MFHVALSSTYQSSNKNIMYQDSIAIPRKAIIMRQEPLSSQELLLVSHIHVTSVVLDKSVIMIISS